ncbi:NAD-dependent succinate-semialdehyde dehydrogenase [Gracilibacillus caseinilyticus]|uniref:Aldehyde dehydrogenase n=1 Tax=Gracilibacillus caseinilyticus TaxID=2932256 RepID=A0ABY4EWG6_9BACI|nr:NAD-dependent succinate-semialdehyde dehydrogenase [Gracilibacillus caseinilyticus]UOQ48619.1 NAD-dependent succinate-semialdehyde dehydrogenase [Gracilibacillus caseinilyticus]
MNGLNYINGEWTGQQLEQKNIYNPATGDIVGTIPKAGAKETSVAIDAAAASFKSWSEATVYERYRLLKEWAKLIIDQKEEIARIMTLEMGKPLAESRGEIDYAVSYIDWYAEEGKRIYGEVIPSHKPNNRMQVWKKPVGVVAAITPWNFPAAMLTRKMAPAFAAGCTVVVKPSGETPLTAIKLVELCHEAGFPAGVVNIVTGSSTEIGGELMGNAKVKKVTFTGSTAVGKKLMEQGAKQLKRLSLELGGHAPIIILDDTDLDKAVEGTMASKFRNAGQTCVCGNRIYVQEGIYDAFIERFAEKVKSMKLGNGLNSDTDIGPLINHGAVEKVEEHVNDAVSKGAQVVVGGDRNAAAGDNYYAPTVLKDVNANMIVMKEETFGPVAPIQKVRTDAEAIQLANDTPYGLAAYVFTENLSRGMKLIENLDYGVVGWNEGIVSAAQAPFGGMKESGVGREGGHQGIEDFLEKQYVSIGI